MSRYAAGATTNGNGCLYSSSAQLPGKRTDPSFWLYFAILAAIIENESRITFEKFAKVFGLKLLSDHRLPAFIIRTQS